MNVDMHYTADLFRSGLVKQLGLVSELASIPWYDEF